MRNAITRPKEGKQDVQLSKVPATNSTSQDLERLPCQTCPTSKVTKAQGAPYLETRIPLHSSQLSVQLRSIVESSVPKASLGSDCRHIQSFKGSEGTRPSPVKGTTFNSDAFCGDSIALLKTQVHVLSLFHTCLSCVPPLNKSVIAHT